MAKFLFKGNLSAEGAAGILAEGGTAREAVVRSSVEAMGGSLECLYYAFGATDAYAIVDLPDNDAAAALALEISSTGRLSVETVVLISPGDLDRLRGKTSGFRAPGA
jgi:uncharacterized protein with GYD domain